jgi:hypothetical protein
MVSQARSENDTSARILPVSFQFLFLFRREGLASRWKGQWPRHILLDIMLALYYTTTAAEEGCESGLLRPFRP